MTRPSVRAISLVTLAALFGITAGANAQPPDPPREQARRPRIGLALGGGSARGIAHIGVLRWFEEHHIPIDVIAGTSMGGLIAGAYASGMTPDEISELMKKADWDLMFLSDSPYKYKTIRRKQDKRLFPSQLEFGLKGGLTLPGGLNPGQQVSLMLDQIALPYYDLKSFDDLPTPYRCVATDLRKGEAIVLGRPPLARAMRATMAIPGVFTPVNWDDWLLVDGGVLNNVPVDVVKQMGADVVIAVNVGADAASDKVAASLFALLGRTIDTMMSVGVRTSLAEATLVIDPDLKGLNSGSWRDTDELAARGFAAADAAAGKLDQYAMTAEDHAAFLAARQAKRKTTVPVPSYLSMKAEGVPLSPRVERDIRRTLNPSLGKPITSDNMPPEILRVTGTDRYEYLTYGMTNEPTPTGLEIGVHQKSYGPPFLMLGLYLNNIDSTSFAVNAAARILQYDALGSGSELRADFVLGTTQHFAVELLEPIASSSVFVAPRAYYVRDMRNLFDDDVLVAEYRFKRTGAGLDLGVEVGRVAEIRLGYDINDVRGRRRVGSPDLPAVDGTEKFASLSVVFDNQNSPVVPSRGTRVVGSLRQFFSAGKPTLETGESVPFGSQNFTSGEFDASWFKRMSAADRLFAFGGAGSSFGESPLINDFSLGGLLRLGAFNNDQLRGDNYLLMGGGYLHRVARLPDVLGGNMFVGGWVEAGSAFDAWDTKDWKSDASAGIIMESLLGPIFGGVSVGFTGGARFYVAIGPLFR
jgi:NTE family protein